MMANRMAERVKNRKAERGKNVTVIPVERIERLIFLIRGQKVMLDYDLADLYGVPTKGLKQAVRRNIDRFPSDFMFQVKPPHPSPLPRKRGRGRGGGGRIKKEFPIQGTYGTGG